MSKRSTVFGQDWRDWSSAAFLRDALHEPPWASPPFPLAASGVSAPSTPTPRWYLHMKDALGTKCY